MPMTSYLRLPIAMLSSSSSIRQTAMPGGEATMAACRRQQFVPVAREGDAGPIGGSRDVLKGNVLIA